MATVRHLALTFVLLFTNVLSAQTKFVQITKENDIPKTLETATARYEKDGIKVDLISAIHIGDYEYYESLNRKFKDYDVVLYELVAPKGVIPDKEKMGLYKIIGMFLHLDSQTRVIDYKAKNFVHADLTPEEMAKSIKDKGHDGFTIVLSLATDMMRKNNLNKGKPQPDFKKFETNDSSVYYKRILAQQMEAGATAEGIMHTLLIEDRNNAALKGLDTEIKNGHKKIAIFYGAAHMPDFEKKLTKQGYKKTDSSWQIAWDIKPQRKALLRLLLDD